MLLLCGGLCSLPVQASESAWPVRKDALYLEMQTQAASYSNGEPAPVQQFGQTARFEYGYLDRAAVAVEIPFVSLSRPASPGLAQAFAPQVTGNGFGDLWLGHYLRLNPDEPLALTLRTGLALPLGYNTTVRPLIGEGQLNLDLALLSGWSPTDSAYLQAGVGYRLRGAYNGQHLRQIEARNAGQAFDKPADQLFGLLEGGYWLLPQLLFSLSLAGDWALSQTRALRQSQLFLRPRLAWRLRPEADLSLQWDQPLWSENSPFAPGLRLGLHLRFGAPLPRALGLRGAVADPYSVP